MKLLFLSITTYMGSVPGARHYFGRIVSRFDSKEKTECGVMPRRSVDENVWRPMTGKEAKRENKEQDVTFYSPGSALVHFETEAEVRLLGIEITKKLFPDAILIEGDAGTCSAQPVLYVPEKAPKPVLTLARKMTALATEWNSIGGYDRGNNKRLGKIDDDYQKLFKKLEEA